MRKLRLSTFIDYLFLSSTVVIFDENQFLTEILVFIPPKVYFPTSVKFAYAACTGNSTLKRQW